MKIIKVERLQKGKIGKSINDMKFAIACTYVYRDENLRKDVKEPIVFTCDDERDQKEKYNQIKLGDYSSILKEI